jgi:hypothetical protein
MWERCKEVGGEDERGQDEKRQGHAVIRGRDHWQSEHVTNRIHSTKMPSTQVNIFSYEKASRPHPSEGIHSYSQRLCLDVSRVRAFLQLKLSLLLYEVTGDAEAGYTAVAHAAATDLIPVANIATGGALVGEIDVNRRFVWNMYDMIVSPAGPIGSPS